MKKKKLNLSKLIDLIMKINNNDGIYKIYIILMINKKLMIIYIPYLKNSSKFMI